ncbi:MAG: hypothetical protein ACREMO_13215 [Gemmatimonadales bacterium]
MRSPFCLVLCFLFTLPLAAQTSWTFVRPERSSPPVFFQDTALSESSAVVVSRTQPGVLWTLNDSGNDPLLFAVDSLGRTLATFRVRGAVNEDWESLDTGPCGTTRCLYIGDTGDNQERRAWVVVYRVAEPAVRAGSAREGDTDPAERLQVRYPDGPHDVEAMLVTRAGNLLLITKGRSGSILLFRVPASAWAGAGVVTAEALGRLSIIPDLIGRQVTDAALAPDNRTVAIRTYREIFFFLRTKDDRLKATRPPVACDISGLEPQGEGVDWLDDRRLVLTSERSSAPAGSIHVVQCR